jgi:hypothetical protein
LSHIRETGRNTPDIDTSCTNAKEHNHPVENGARKSFQPIKRRAMEWMMSWPSSEGSEKNRENMLQIQL